MQTRMWANRSQRRFSRSIACARRPGLSASQRVLMRSARQLAKLCRQGTALVHEARDHQADPAVIAAARKMASDLTRTKHAVP